MDLIRMVSRGWILSGQKHREYLIVPRTKFTFFSTFLLVKIFCILIQISFLKVHLTVSQHCLAPNRQEAITWASDDLIGWCMCTSSGLIELMMKALSELNVFKFPWAAESWHTQKLFKHVNELCVAHKIYYHRNNMMAHLDKSQKGVLTYSAVPL